MGEPITAFNSSALAVTASLTVAVTCSNDTPGLACMYSAMLSTMSALFKLGGNFKFSKALLTAISVGSRSILAATSPCPAY